MNRKKSTISTNIVLNDIPIQLERKSIKNINIVVYAPDGRVRVAAPLQLTDREIHQAIGSRLSWIQKKQLFFQARPRPPKREMITGAYHYVFGKEYQLEVIERRGRHEIVLSNHDTLQLFVNPGTLTENRALVLKEWYRSQLKIVITELLNIWQPIIGKQVNSWTIRKMKTKWGCCHTKKRRIWLNLELAKKPISCIEYILVHELVHLWEPLHNERFYTYMDKFLPQWRQESDLIDSIPLSHL